MLGQFSQGSSHLKGPRHPRNPYSLRSALIVALYVLVSVQKFPSKTTQANRDQVSKGVGLWRTVHTQMLQNQENLRDSLELDSSDNQRTGGHQSESAGRGHGRGCREEREGVVRQLHFNF